MLSRGYSLPISDHNHHYHLTTFLLLFSAATLFFTVISVSACSQRYGKHYFPVSKTSRWEYSATVVYENGQAVNGTVINQFDGEAIIRGRKYFKFISTSEFPFEKTTIKNTEIYYYRVGSKGIYKIDDKRKDKPEYLEMPLPIRTGTTWMSQPPGGNTTVVRAEHVGTVEANGREYGDCLKVTYRYEDETMIIDYFLAPHIGIVKGTITKLGSPSSTTEIFLKRYQDE